MGNQLYDLEALPLEHLASQIQHGSFYRKFNLKKKYKCAIVCYSFKETQRNS